MIETMLLDALVARFGADNDFEAVGVSSCLELFRQASCGNGGWLLGLLSTTMCDQHRLSISHDMT